jgi:hypothetical protein
MRNVPPGIHTMFGGGDCAGLGIDATNTLSRMGASHRYAFRQQPNPALEAIRYHFAFG